MPKIGQILANRGLSTRAQGGYGSQKVASQTSFAGLRRNPIREVSGSGFGVAEGHMMAVALNKLADVSKRRENYDNGLWVEAQTTRAQKEWMQWINIEQHASEPGLLERLEEQYNSYMKEVLEAAPSPEAAAAITENLNGIGVKLLGQGLNIEANTKKIINIKDLNDLLLVSQDALSESNTPTEDLKEQMATTTLAVEAAYSLGKIDRGVRDSFNESISMMPAVLAEHLVGTDPDKAKEILDGAKNIPIEKRTAIENKIRVANNTNNSLERARQQEQLKNNIKQIEQTGEANPLFNIDNFTAATSKGAGHEAKSMIKAAHLFHKGKSKMEGVSKSEISAILQENMPKKNDPDYAAKLSVYQDLQRKAAAQVELMEKDAFTYSQQNPTVRKLMEDMAEADPATQAIMLPNIIKHSLTVQESLGIPNGLRAVTSKAKAIEFAATLNHGQPQDVIDGLNSAMVQYGEYFPRVIGDASRLPESQRIDTNIQIAAKHLGKPWVADFINASRIPSSEYGLESTELSDLRDELSSNRDLSDFQESLLATSLSEDRQIYAKDFYDASEKYAVSLTKRGMSPRKAAQAAIKAIISEEYAFGVSSDQVYAINRKYVTNDGVMSSYTNREIDNIERGLNMMLGKGKLPWYARQVKAFPGLNPKRIDLERLNLPSLTDPEDFMVDKAFWATTPDNNGVQLYAPGIMGTAQRVYDKDGSEISMSFEQALKSYNAFYEEQNPSSNLRFGR